MSQLIRVSNETYEKIRRLAFEQRVSQGDMVADMLITYLDLADATGSVRVPVLGSVDSATGAVTWNRTAMTTAPAPDAISEEPTADMVERLR